MKIQDLIEMTLPAEHEPHNDFRKWSEAATKWTGQKPTSHIVHHKGELVARWHDSTNTGWVTKKSVNETADVVDIKKQLKQAESDYDEMSKNPGNQAGYDALDDMRHKIKQLKNQLERST